MTVYVAFIPALEAWEEKHLLGVYKSKEDAEKGITKQGYDKEIIGIEEVEFFNTEEV